MLRKRKEVRCLFFSSALGGEDRRGVKTMYWYVSCFSWFLWWDSWLLQQQEPHLLPSTFCSQSLMWCEFSFLLLLFRGHFIKLNNYKLLLLMCSAVWTRLQTQNPGKGLTHLNPKRCVLTLLVYTILITHLVHFIASFDQAPPSILLVINAESLSLLPNALCDITTNPANIYNYSLQYLKTSPPQMSLTFRCSSSPSISSGNQWRRWKWWNPWPNREQIKHRFWRCRVLTSSQAPSSV